MSTAPTRPNVLLICVDQMSASLMRAAGHPCVMTPTLSHLAACGTRFTQCYSATPSCVPARRSLMTGLTARTHGDRRFNTTLPMPDAPTLAQCFADAGYQAYAVGKLHVYPQRSRIGFHDVILNEEGRHLFGNGADDWEQFLAEQGFAGQEYAGGGCNNDYHVRPWHLPDACHQTNWSAREMCKVIRRRDPGRPAFWYLSFAAPHPPMWPLQAYLDLYRDVPIDEPVMGDWAARLESLPWMLRQKRFKFSPQFDRIPQHELLMARRAFYAMITHVDHQIRVVIGMLREQGLLSNTIIALTSDHGDMLGDHGLWAKSILYDQACRVPLLVLPTRDDNRLAANATDDRLVDLVDVMPTLLDLAGVPIPSSVEGRSLLAPQSRDHLYAEHGEGAQATRMVRDDRYKLIYYAAGNRMQLFDLSADPRECRDLSGDPGHQGHVQRLKQCLISHLYGEDQEWLRDGALVGIPEPTELIRADRGLEGQRGFRFL